MFNNKLKEEIYGRDKYLEPGPYGKMVPRKLGLINEIKLLKLEINKLKGIVAEMTNDYYETKEKK